MYLYKSSLLQYLIFFGDIAVLLCLALMQFKYVSCVISDIHHIFQHLINVIIPTSHSTPEHIHFFDHRENPIQTILRGNHRIVSVVNESYGRAYQRAR